MGDGLAIIEEFALQTAGHQQGLTHLEGDVAVTQGDDHLVVAVGADALHFGQSVTRNHKREGIHAKFSDKSFSSQGQAVAVHRHQGQGGVLHLEEGAGVDRSGLVGAHGKEHLGEHGPEGGLGQGDGTAVVHGGQLGKFVGGAAHDVKRGGSTGNVDGISLGGHGDHVVGQLSDDLTKQSCRQNQRTGLGDLGVHPGDDAGFQIVSRQAQTFGGGLH